jgi:uncharacterized membrane protein YhaH (DUF805 family)
MLDIESLLLSPRGRIGRQTYWTLIGPIAAATLLLSLIPFFGALAPLPLLWPFGCVSAQRLHDGGRRAWPVPIVAGLAGAATMLSFAVTMMATDPAQVVAAFGWALPVTVLSGVATIATLALILIAGLHRGAAGLNRFGAPERMPLTLAALLPRDR